MFKFGFSQPDTEDLNEYFVSETAKKESSKINNDNKKEVIPKAEFKEIIPDMEKMLFKNPNEINFDEYQDLEFPGGQSLIYLEPDDDLLDIYSKKDVSTEGDHSDLIPGVYEGGGKIWECTFDLGNFLTEKSSDNTSLLDTFKDKTILDVGCGAGILGILALHAGAEVHFHDYNEEVISKITLKNIQSNCPENEELSKLLSRCRFYSGDWDDFCQNTNNVKNDTKFDVILTSETIYNPTNYQSLVNVFKSKLKTNGTIYLAAKIYYFGVGGGIRDFEKLLNDDGTFLSNTVWTITENVGREILEIKRKL